MNLTSVTGISNFTEFVHRDWLLWFNMDALVHGYVVIASKVSADSPSIVTRSILTITTSLAKAYQVCKRSGALSSPQCYLKNAAGFWLVDSGIIRAFRH